MNIAISDNQERVVIEIDGEAYELPSGVDAIEWAFECEEAAEAEGDWELAAWGWKVAALFLARRAVVE